jgi:mannose-6-phosphate isomerase-like protein (cupin superfamily)
MGGRMTSTLASQGGLGSVRGLVFFGFPLHAPGREGVERGLHLADVSVPMLFLQGTRDKLADPSLIRQVTGSLGDRATLHVVEEADHGFHVLKRSGRTDADVIEELAETTAAWTDTLEGPMTRTEKVNLTEKFDLFDDHWHPRIVGQVGDTQVKVARLVGEFDWHAHENEDELFLVHRGRLLIRLRDRDVWLDEGEFFIVPGGVEHQPVAEQEVELVLIEPAGTLNTGDAESDRTVRDLEWI